MVEDFSCIKLYKNDFASAKLADDTAIQTLPYGGFIVLSPSKLFLQTSAGTESISFVGGIQVDLINCSGTVVQNIDSNFYYVGAVDSDGVNQISFEFGFIGTDYWTKQLYLKITDLVNGNIWYSNGFLVTDYRGNLTTELHYFNPTKIYNISYDLLPYTQNIAIAECYDQTPVNKRELKQYINSSGRQTNYRTITTFLRKYIIGAVDYFLNDRLEAVFAHGQVYVNRERAMVSDYKVEEREFDVNYLKGEFTVNPQGQRLPVTYQIYQYLNVVSTTPAHNGNYTTTSLPAITLTFNKNMLLETGFNIKLYKNGVLQTISPAIYSGGGTTTLTATLTYTFTNGSYSIIIEPDLVVAGAEKWEGFGAGEWNFTISAGEFDNTEFNNTEYLTN